MNKIPKQALPIVRYIRENWRKLKHWNQRRTANVEPIKIAEKIWLIYHKLGREAGEYPKKGFRFQAEMKSGRIAVYKITKIENTSFGCDWNWLVATFHHWKERDEIYPKYC